MKIYTKHGDKGFTSLMGEAAVAKDDIRIEANGMLDELNAALGVAKVSMAEPAVVEQINAVQNMIMRVMGVVAGGKMGDSTLVSELTARMEREIDSMRTDGKFCFVVPGETPLNAWLHVARTKCRTAERRLWTMNASYPLDPEIMKFVNRLSDYLFVLAINC